jgi:thioredoxin-related protein
MGGGGGVAFEGRDMPLEQVLARSRATGKPAMLYFATTWCGYCRKLERETLPSPEVGRHMAGYVNVEYGADGGVGKQLADRYGVRGFPTLVRIDGSGAKVAVYEGFDPPADFVRRIPSP